MSIPEKEWMDRVGRLDGKIAGLRAELASRDALVARMAEALRGLVFNPVIRGLRAHIRDQAKRGKYRDPLPAGEAILADPSTTSALAWLKAEKRDAVIAAQMGPEQGAPLVGA